jgi:LysM repeat protein
MRPSPDPIARILAVLALVVAAIVVVVLVVGSTGGPQNGAEQGQGGTGKSRAQRESYCVVRAGDTFAAIAVQAQVPETRLARLNPNLDQFSIQPQNCVNLVPEGCKELANGGAPAPCT